jgi:hypothetical protein
MGETPFVTEPNHQTGGGWGARVDVSYAICDGRSRPHPYQGTPRSDYRASTEELCQGRYSGATHSHRFRAFDNALDTSGKSGSGL